MGKWLYIFGAGMATLPGLFLRINGIHTGPLSDSLIFGISIVGAAFLLSWATEVAEMDISQALALAFLALVAVLPEYSVDLYLAWTAAHDPVYTQFAIANMTGANRLLIGFGWSLVVVLYWLKSRNQAVRLEKAQSTEIVFLAIAALYALTIPLKQSVALIDTVLLFGLFVAYVWRAAQAEKEETHLMGPAAAIGTLAAGWRRTVVVFIFLFSAVVILSAAEPFAEGLLATGKTLGIDEFLLIQWVAPLASEAPEITICSLFALRRRERAGLGALVSSMVNQWTLLVGSLALVYSIGLGAVGALPLHGRQTAEVLLTASQAVFAVVLISNLRLSVWGAAVLFTIFFSQLLMPEQTIRYIYAGTYLVLALGLIVFSRAHRSGLIALWSVALGRAEAPVRKREPSVYSKE